MNHSVTIEEIRQRHEEVYGEILRNPSLAQSGPERDAFLSDRVYPLLNDMKVLPTTVMSVEDYAWLSDTVSQWQVVFSSIFNIPRRVEILPPRQLSPTTERYTPDKLDELLKQESFFLSQARLLEGLAEYIRYYKSTPAEMARDWRNAKVNLVYWLLTGKINFARQIMPESYCYVEEIWLEELRRVTAYFHWIAEGKHLWNHEADYCYARVYIREKLADPHIKASLQDFEAVKGYLEARYLTDGEIDTTKEATIDLIGHKAHRLWKKTGEHNCDKNWIQAEAYVKKYYEHIMAAVTENDTSSIEAVLEAFQLGTEPERDAVINCFEVLVAAYFIDSDTVQRQFSQLTESAL